MAEKNKFEHKPLSGLREYFDNVIRDQTLEPPGKKYTVEAGRQIYRDGKPWLYLGGCVEPKTKMHYYQPVEADRLVYVIVDMLNDGGYEFDDKELKWLKTK